MIKAARHLRQTILAVTRSIATLASSAMRSRAQLGAENLSRRRECLDFMILMSERHVRVIAGRHYNRGRPHASLGPGIPEGAIAAADVREWASRWVPVGCRVAATPILGGLHHEYRLERHAA